MNEPTNFEEPDEFSIAYLARTTGISSRTLRHYDHIGLFSPHRVASNGYRFYAQDQLVRLQRILVLKDMGLSLENIAEILERQSDEREALKKHVEQLQLQRETLDRQILALKHSITALETGETMKPETSFDGFNEQYKQEVTERWGSEAYNSSNKWWRSKTKQGQSEFFALVQELNDAWIQAGNDQVSAESEVAQSLAARHVQWLSSVPGTPLGAEDPEKHAQYIESLADMYVADERFAKNYGGHAPLVRDALKFYLKNTTQP